MSTYRRLRRRLPELLACLGSVALTAAILGLGAVVQPGAPIHLWFLAGAAAAAA
jgi:hypothetical protein